MIRATKSAIITARNIAKKNKKMRYRQKMDDKKQSKKAKNLFDSLKIDPSSILFSEEILDKEITK